MLKQRFNGVSREIQFGGDGSIVDKRFGLFNVADGKTVHDYFYYGGIGLSKIGGYKYNSLISAATLSVTYLFS